MSDDADRHRDQATRNLTLDRRCESLMMDGSPCPGTVNAPPVTAGCVHEHIRTGYLCLTCRNLLLLGKVNCEDCYDSPQPHPCARMAGPVS